MAQTRKLFLFALIFLTVIFSAFANECQYTTNETYFVSEEKFYMGKTYIGTDLDMTTVFPVVVDGYKITVGNQLPVNVELNLTYTRYSLNWKLNNKISQNIIVGSKNSFTYTDEWIQSMQNNPQGSGSILDATVTLSPWLFVNSSIEQVPYNRIVCLKCEGTNCLNDGMSCERSSQCGSNICNIRKECGTIGTPFVVSCPDNQNNCNDLKCAIPSTKEVGQRFDCEWECRTQYGVDNICQRTPQEIQRERNNQLIMYAIIASIILIGGISYILYHKNTLTKTSIEKLKADTEAKKVELEIEKINRSQLKDDIERGKQKLQKIKNSLKGIKGKAREAFENEIRREEERQAERKIALDKSILEIKQREKRVEERKKEIAENETKIDEEHQKKIKQKLEEQSQKERELKENEEKLNNSSYQLKIKGALDKYGERYAGIEFNSKTGYIVFKNTGSPLHRHIYKQQIGTVAFAEDVHHIDADKLNNELWNLIALHFTRHKKFKHNMKLGDWEEGIKQLKKQLNMTDEDFHEHILKRMKK